MWAAKTTDSPRCITIRTGNPDCLARFYPALFQLSLVKQGVEEKVDLGFSGCRLLERLILNPGEVISREVLMEHAWPGRVVGQGSLNQLIYTLRQLLGDEKERRIIQTLPRRGYLLNPNCIEFIEKPVSDSASSLSDNALSVSDSAPSVSELTTKPPARARMAAVKRFSTVMAGWMSMLAMGTLFTTGSTVHSLATTADSLLTITYAPHSADDLNRLTVAGELLGNYLGTDILEPLHLVVGVREQTLNLVCLHQDGSAHSLFFSYDTIDKLDQSDLAPCLAR